MRRISLVPTKRALTEDVFYTVVMGTDIDIPKALENQEILFKFIRNTTKRPGLEFGEIKNLSSYRFALHLCCRSFPMALTVSSCRPNNSRVVNVSERAMFLLPEVRFIPRSTMIH